MPASPSLDITSALTFDENVVNAAPQLLAPTALLTDSDDDFSGGSIVVSGLLAEDRVSLLSDDYVSLTAGVLYYDADGVGGAAAVTIGTVSGGVGGTFTITLASGVTTAIAQSVVQHLTYANVSDEPTASRDLAIEIIDGDGLGLLGDPVLTEVTGAGNTLEGVDFDGYSKVTLGDVDGDGDLDLVMGHSSVFKYFENTGSATAPVFELRENGDNPFSAIVTRMHMASGDLIDLDGDGDLDLLSGCYDGTFEYFENVGDATNPSYVARNGGDNPLSAFRVGDTPNPIFVDLDNDGDLDAVIGEFDGGLNYLENVGTAQAPSFVQRAGQDNPFDSIITGERSAPALGDFDKDGDLDLLIGTYGAGIRYFENTGDSANPVYSERFGAANPFDSTEINWGGNTAPRFVDLNGDGLLDVLLANNDNVRYFLNTTPSGVTITVGVTAQAEHLVGGSGSQTLSGGVMDDFLDGGAGDDELIGGAGADYLRGGTGDDVMRGGAGNDKYVVDSAGDVVDEGGGDGVDEVWSTVSWTLGTDVENLVLTAAGRAIDGTGNGLNNDITGNAFANILSGQQGDDTLRGEGGADTLYGGEARDSLYGGTQNDYLDGGSDDDVMAGGLHNDTYVVDSFGDQVIELAGEGTDTIMSGLSGINLSDYANVENLILTGPAVEGYGNALNNVITGNAENNTIEGRDGIDTLYGMDGDDFLIGGAGADKLYGGSGADTFKFQVASEMASDRIYDLDFSEGDIIDLSSIYADTLAFAARFTGTAGQVVVSYNSTQDLTWVKIDLDGDKVVDAQISISGNHAASTGNLYTGGGDTDGGWIL